MAKIEINILTRLNSGIYVSEGGGIARLHYTYALGPLNLRRALAVLRTHRKDMVDRYGNWGCGQSWIEIGGKALSEIDLGYYQEGEDRLTLPSAKALIAEHIERHFG